VTGPQREALVLAVERGYYDIPRRCSTAELAAVLGVSDQAVSERLRRGIATLVERTLGDDAGEQP
jgi:predicted DNA binding protein